MLQYFPKRSFRSLFQKNSSPSLAYVCNVGPEASHMPRSMHEHPHLAEILLLYGGAGIYMIDGRRYTAQKGDLILYNSHVVHDEHGGSGSEHDRQSMYLLMQSHQRLGNCESVINIGNRYISRFRNSPEAADAMFSIGQCQWNMQQRDVARDTWRKLMLIYPDSAAAKKAAKHADKY